MNFSKQTLLILILVLNDKNMIKTNGESNVQQIYSARFDKCFRYHSSKLITLKAIMKPLNRFYNKQTDSVAI